MARKAPHDDETLLAELSQLYREVDAMHAGFTCPASTECCRFGLTGRQPYVTSIELLAIRRAIARRGGMLSEKRRALPIQKSAESERVCPLLDRAQRCSIYADRPLGCRTFYCERATRGQGAERDQLRDVMHRLQELAARHRLSGEHARPLTRALEE